MTEDRDPIRRYLDELRLSLRIPEVGRILVEAEDHLRDATAAGMAAGLTEREAQQAVITGFGPVREIVYAHQTRHGRVAAMLADLALALWRVVPFYLLTDFAVGLRGLLMTPGAAACASRSCPVLPAVPEATTVAALAVWAAMGAAGVALLAAYFLVRRVQRHRGRVWSVPGRQFIYRLYARMLRRQLAGGRLPRHVGIIMDGNRRWARQRGMADPSLGHKYGAEHAEKVLGWCEKAGIRHVTVFMCSTENLLAGVPGD